MAGIGFLLRKLAAQDNYSGIIRAYFHSAVAAVGPWIMVVISLGTVTTFTYNTISLQEANEFLAIVIYNFFFSFMLAGPLYMVSARYVADCLYLRNIAPIPGIFITSLYFLIIPALIISSVFYIFHATMTPLSIVLSVVNFVFLSEVWIIMLYLTCIRNFRAITFSWIICTVLVIILGINWGLAYGSVGMLAGFNIGLICLIAALKGNIIAEYPYRFRKAKEFGFYFKFYKGLFWSGFFLYAGMWIDKVIMWWAPESILHLTNLRTYPIYDGGMFLSYLSIIPVMGLFIFSLETNFYDSYIRYIQQIERNAPLALIEEEKAKIVTKIIENGRSFLILQGSISLIIIAFAPTLFDWLGTDFLELSIFRQGALGAFFSALNLFIVIIFSYFDSQDNMLKVTGTMLVSNIVLTLIAMQMGFPFYGYGFSLSMIITFFVGATLLARFLNQLTYHIFITNIVKRQTILEHYTGNEMRIGAKEDEFVEKVFHNIDTESKPE